MSTSEEITPRTRVYRNPPRSARVDDHTPTAGPSRLAMNTPHPASPFLDDDDDDESTPRVNVRNNFTPSSPTETPRLRDILARYQSLHNDPRQASQLINERTPSLPSELESDEPQHRSFASEALSRLFSHALREPGSTPTKKNTRRNSIDTSEVEVVEDSPRLERIAQERARNKGKRKSMSDEEAERSSKSTRDWEDASSRSSQAAHFDALRRQLKASHPDTDNSVTDDDGDTSRDTAELVRQFSSESFSLPAATSTPARSLMYPSQMHMHSDLMESDSEMHRAIGDSDSLDASLPPRPLKSPRTGSRPLGHTNSMPDVGDVPSDSAYNKPRKENKIGLGRASSLPSADFQNPTTTTPPRDTLRHHRTSHSQNGSPLVLPPTSRRSSVASIKSFDSDFSSHVSSVGSSADHRDRQREIEKEKNAERERMWNKPKASPGTRNRTTSNLSVHNLSDHRRRTSSNASRPTSVMSTVSRDDFRPSSPTGSAVSSSLRSSAGEEEVVVSQERERNWNSPHPKWNHTPRRSLSPLPQITPSPPHAQARTRPSPGARPRSQVILPTKAQMPTTPRTRTQSLEASAMVTPPKDDLHATLRATPSPSPSPLGARRTSRDMTKSPSPSPGSLRARPNSSYSTGNIHGELVDRTNRLSPRPRPSSYHASSSSLDQRPRHQLVPRPNSPIPSTTPEKPPPNGYGSADSTPEGKDSPSRGLSSHFGFRFPKNKPLPPLDLGSDSPERRIVSTSTRPSSRASIGSGKPSHIPVRSPGNKSRSSSSGSVVSNDANGRSPSGSPTSSPTFQRVHKRTTTEFSEGSGSMPQSTTPPPMTPTIYVGSEQELDAEVDMDLESEPEVQVEGREWDEDQHDDDSVRESDEEMSVVATPLARTIELEDLSSPAPVDLSPSPRSSPPPQRSHGRDFLSVERTNNHDLARLQRALGTSPAPSSPPRERSPSPPSTPPLPMQPESPFLSPTKQELPTFEISTLSTPPRKSSSNSFAASRTEYATPSPPKGGLPDLPGPPSEDEENDVERTPVRSKSTPRQVQQLEFSTLKTPAVPGAWLTTPAPAKQEPAKNARRGLDDSYLGQKPKKTSRGRSNSDSAVEDNDGRPEERTPLNPLNRTNSLPTRTPAPPGAWVNTPATVARRRSLLKVRFEEEAPPPNFTSDSAPSDTEGILPRVKFDVDGSESSLNGLEFVPGPGPAVVSEVADMDMEGGNLSFEGVHESSPSPVKSETRLPPTSSSNGHAHANGDHRSSEPPTTPLRTLASPFRGKRETPNGSVRMVDEFGEVRGGEEKPAGSPLRRDISVSMRMPGGMLQTPRSKSVVRILDAMGREVEEEGRANESDSTILSGYESPADRAAALARVKKVTADLRVGLGDAQKLSDFPANGTRLQELDQVSTAAREARTRISLALKQAENGQTQRVRSASGPLATLISKQKSALSNLVPRPTSIWNPWFIASFFLLQIIIIIFMYRLSVKYAKHQFLTSYFDPFYADLHLHRDKPYANYDPKVFTFYHKASSADSSHLALRLLRKASSAIWNGLTGTVSRWQRSAWDAWGVPSIPVQTKRVAWPPS